MKYYKVEMYDDCGCCIYEKEVLAIDGYDAIDLIWDDVIHCKGDKFYAYDGYECVAEVIY